MNIKSWYNGLSEVKNAMDTLSSIDMDKNGALLKSSLAIEGLSEKQAKLALSTANLTKTEQLEVLQQANLAQSASKISAEKAKEILTTTSLDKEKQKEVLSTLGLTEAEGVYVAMTKEAIKKKLESMVQTGALTAEKKNEILAAIGTAAANQGEIVSRKGLVGVMAKQLAMQLKLIATNPVTWIVAGVAAFFALDKAYLIHNIFT